MRLNTDQVKKAAKLANLALSGAEEEKFALQLSKILDYIDELNLVNTDSVEPTFNVAGKANVLRKDESGSGLSQEDALMNASVKKDGFFVTGGVFKE